MTNSGYYVGCRVANRFAVTDLGTVTVCTEIGIQVAWDNRVLDSRGYVPMMGCFKFGDVSIPRVVNMDGLK